MNKDKYDDYKNYIKGLKNEYGTAFEKIEVYINGSPKLNFSEKNNCFLQILDTFLSGQEEGKSVKEITGANLKKYCDDMIYGETIYIYKAARICFILLSALVYVSYIQIFFKICEAIRLKDSSLIFLPMNFGIADIVLILGCTCIPKLRSIITRNYFENPVRCKRVKRYTNCALWFSTILIYSFIKEPFEKYIIVIPFSNTVLILIYLTLISLVVWVLMKIMNEGNSEEKKAEKEHKYFERLNKEYKTYVKKFQMNSKNAMNFNKFKRKKIKSNSLFIKIYFADSIIFLVFAISIGRWMLVEGNIDVLGIIVLVVVSFIDVVTVLAVREFMRIKKQLVQIESKE